MAMRANSRQ